MIEKTLIRTTKKHSAFLSTMILGIAALSVASCGKAKTQILIDGSSTVYPITEAVAEEYRKASPNVNVTVGISGTGGGFKKFCNKETQISDASRPIKKSEMEACQKGSIEFIELPVAYDGLAVIVNPNNKFVKQLTVEQLKKIFDYNGPAKTWKEVDPSFPDKPIKVYSPGQDSGTYDYFTEVIIGERKVKQPDGTEKKEKPRVRSDAAFSEDDNVLVTGVAGDEFAIGFFGLAYYEENASKLKVVPVVNPKTKTAVVPNLETVKSGEYAPLSRPLFIYVEKAAASREDVKGFVDFYLKNSAKLSKQVGYIPLTDAVYAAITKRFADKALGTVYGGEHSDKSLETLYSVK